MRDQEAPGKISGDFACERIDWLVALEARTSGTYSRNEASDRISDLFKEHLMVEMSHA
jgi:hypothetical protein